MATIKDMVQVLIDELMVVKSEQRVIKKNVLKIQADMNLLREEMKKGFKETHERLDKQGKQLAYLEDDTPTREEFEKLAKRFKN